MTTFSALRSGILMTKMSLWKCQGSALKVKGRLSLNQRQYSCSVDFMSDKGVNSNKGKIENPPVYKCPDLGPGYELHHSIKDYSGSTFVVFIGNRDLLVIRVEMTQ